MQANYRFYTLLCAFCAVLGTPGCASDDTTGQDGRTSVAVLEGDDGILGSSEVSGGQNSILAPPSYPSRDANLFAANASAWHTFLSTHWGSADWIGASYDFAHMIDALAVNIELSSGLSYVGLAEAVYARMAAGGYDYAASDTLDTPAFMALGLAHLYNAAAAPMVAQQLLHRDELLALAQNQFTAVLAAETTDSNNVSLGLFWDSTHQTRRTPGNAGAVLAAVQLYQATGDAAFLDFAKRVYRAWFTAAVDPNTYSVADGVAVSGIVDASQYTYDDGLMIGAAVALHTITGDSQYLREAQGIAGHLIDEYTVTAATNTVLIEPLCTTTACGTGLVYRGLTLRSLAQLAAIDGNNSAVQKVLNGTAAAIVSVRSPTTGHWPIDWSTAGASIQDAASDLSVALGLGYLSLSAPQQAPAVVGGTTALAAEAALCYNLPILPGGDGLGGWATAGIFINTAQTMLLPLWAPFTGDYTLTLRYSNPDPAATTLNLTVGQSATTLALAVASTGGVSTMATTAAVGATLPAGLNTATVSAPSVPANAQLDVLEATAVLNQAGATCAPTSSLVPTSPIAGDRVCGSPTFTWKGGSGSQSRSDIFVDRVLVCTVTGTAQSCTPPAGTLLAGRHVWQVIEDGCSVSALQSFDESLHVPTALTAQVATQNGVTTLTWATSSSSQVVDVALNKTLMCGQLPGNSCVLEAAVVQATGSNAVTLTASNACGQTLTSQTF